MLEFQAWIVNEVVAGKKNVLISVMKKIMDEIVSQHPSAQVGGQRLGIGTGFARGVRFGSSTRGDKSRSFTENSQLA